MPDLQPPTGDEKVQKYYGSPYLDEVDEFKAAVASAAATGTDIDIEGVNPLTVAAVSPQLLDEATQEQVQESKPAAHKPGELGYQEQTGPEANGDEEERVKLGQDVQERDRLAEEKRNEDSADRTSGSGDSLPVDSVEGQVGETYNSDVPPATQDEVEGNVKSPDHSNDPELTEITDSQVDADNKVNPHEAISNPSTHIEDDRVNTPDTEGDPTPLAERGDTEGIEAKQGESGVPTFDFTKSTTGSDSDDK